MQFVANGVEVDMLQPLCFDCYLMYIAHMRRY
jgi:hypothetical protein